MERNGKQSGFLRGVERCFWFCMGGEGEGQRGGGGGLVLVLVH